MKLLRLCCGVYRTPISSHQRLRKVLLEGREFTHISISQALSINHRILCVGLNVCHPHLVVWGQLGDNPYLNLFLWIGVSDAPALNSLQLEIDTEAKALLMQAVLNKNHTHSSKTLSSLLLSTRNKNFIESPNSPLFSTASEGIMGDQGVEQAAQNPESWAPVLGGRGGADMMNHGQRKVA